MQHQFSTLVKNKLIDFNKMLKNYKKMIKLKYYDNKNEVKHWLFNFSS